MKHTKLEQNSCKIVIVFSVLLKVLLKVPLSTNITKWSNTLKELVGNLLTNCLSVFDHFVRLALKGLSAIYTAIYYNGAECGIKVRSPKDIRLSKVFWERIHNYQKSALKDRLFCSSHLWWDCYL